MKYNILYKKLYKVWWNIKDRCYNPKNRRYEQYGGRGVYMCDLWLTLDGFLSEIDLVDGFDEDKLINGEICLDKDSIDINNKEYCLEKCRFISKCENNKYKPSQQKWIIGISPSGEKFEFLNQSEFAREHKLRQSSIGDCLGGKCKTHKGWKFKYK